MAILRGETPACGSGRLRIGDILDETFRIYRRQFRAFVLIMGAVAVPSAIVSIVITVLAGLLRDHPRAGARRPSTGDRGAARAWSRSASSLGMAQVVAAAAVVRISSDAILGLPVDVGAAYREGVQPTRQPALGRLPGRAWSTVALVLTCLGIPFAIYVGLGWMLLIPLIMLEGPARRTRWAELGTGARAIAGGC